MKVNKVLYKAAVLIDLTEDSVTPEKLVKGITAHSKSGEVITGTLEIIQSGNALMIPGSIGRVEEESLKIEL